MSSGCCDTTFVRLQSDLRLRPRKQRAEVERLPPLGVEQKVGIDVQLRGDRADLRLPGALFLDRSEVVLRLGERVQRRDGERQRQGPPKRASKKSAKVLQDDVLPCQ